MQVSSIGSIPHSISFFIASPFFISFFTCLEPREYGKWNGQRPRNGGVLRGTERFLHPIQAGLREHAGYGGAWTEDLQEASLTQHIYTFCSRLLPKSPLADTTTWKVWQYFPWKKDRATMDQKMLKWAVF